MHMSSPIDVQDYEIHFDQRLGKGGFGEVYPAVHLNTRRNVALKLINKDLVKQKGTFKRIWDEVRIHSQLKHPSIVEILDCFQDDSYIYIALELCHNGDLRHYLKSLGRPLDESHAATVLEQVVNGVLYLHSKRIIHRDLSASNILLDSNWNVKIADFGLATQMSQPNEKHFTMCGTPNYIAPEIALRKPHGLEADIWSLGCLLYTLLSGHPPFGNNGQVSQTLKQIITGVFQLPAHISNEAASLIRALMQAEAGHRIRLSAVKSHPFFAKYRSKYGSYMSMTSADSGRGTISTGRNFGSSSTRLPLSTDRPIDNGPYRLGRTSSLRLHGDRRNVLPIPPLPRACSVPDSYASQPCPHSHSRICSHCRASPMDLPPIPAHHSQSVRGAEPVCTSFKQCSSCRGTCTAQPSSSKALPPCHSRLYDHNGQCLRDLVVPFTAKRLAPTKQKTKRITMAITEDSEVVVQVHSKSNSTSSFLRITSDGCNVITYQMGVQSEGDVSREVYTIDTLPVKYWKTYQLASNFVQLIKAKTPKLLLYSGAQKCHLMEEFSVKVYLSDAREATKRSDSQAWTCLDNGQPDLLSSKEEQLCDMLQARCLRLERILRESEGADENNFPAVIGRPIGKQRHSAAEAETRDRAPVPQNRPKERLKASGVYIEEYACSVRKLAEGGMVVTYDTGERITLKKSSNELEYTDAQGRVLRYTSNDALPSWIKSKMAQMDAILGAYANRAAQSDRR